MPKSDFIRKDCEKIDGALDVKAYMNLILDPDIATGIILENSWGDTGVDLLPVVKAGETDTKLSLGPATADDTRTWNYLQYDSERSLYCIAGDDLSRIISMKYLKDVDQITAPVNGDIYMFNGTLFYTFNLRSYMNTINETIADHEDRIVTLEGNVQNLQSTVSNMQQAINQLNNTVQNLTNRIQQLETQLTKPEGVPNDAVVAWGNRNIYSDYTNTNLKTHGIFTHSTATTLADDMYFA